MRISAYSGLTKVQKTSVAGLAAAAGVVALGAGVAPAVAGDGGHGQGAGASAAGSAAPGGKAAQAPAGGQEAPGKAAGVKTLTAGGEDRQGPVSLDASAHAGKAGKAVHAQQAKVRAQDTAQDARGGQSAGRSADRSAHPDNLDGWIKEARSIMKKEGIPGSYQGIKKNVIRESGGDPNVSNDWDVNAKKGTPSKGLLQVIQPTFDQYHVKGTADKLTDPVANITAACNYAADRYGSMDKVDSAY